MDISVIINQMIVLFVIMTIGYIAGKANILSKDGAKMLSKVIINLTQPGLILYSVMNSKINITGGDVIIFLLLIVLIYIISLAVAIPVSHLLCIGKNAPKADRNLYCYMCVFANIAYMGFPVSYVIFGPVSAFYVALFSIIFNLLNFSLGIYLVSGKRDKFDIKAIINPSLIAAIISIPIAIYGYNAPGVIMEITRLTGNMTIPGVMLIIGSSLSFISIKDIISEWRLYPLALVRLIMIPVVTWFILSQFINDDIVLGILVIITGMPVAMASTMLAIEYGGNENIASSGTFISTVLSIVTIPLLVYILFI